MNMELRNGFSNVGLGSLLSAIGLTLMELLQSIPYSSFIGLILGTVGLVFLIRGFGSLRRGGLPISSTGLYLILAGVILTIVIALIFIAVLGFLGLNPVYLASMGRHTLIELLPYAIGVGLMVIVAFLLFLIGGILVGISFYNLGKSYQNTPMEVGGILVAIPFLEFIGYFLTWIGTLEIGKSPVNPYTPYQQNYVQPPVSSLSTSFPMPYQIGAGTIDSSGMAFFTLFSQVQLQITEAQLLDSNTVISQTNSVAPSFLVPGNNNVKVSFASFQGVPGRAYVVRLFLLGGVYVDALVKYLG